MVGSRFEYGAFQLSLGITGRGGHLWYLGLCRCCTPSPSTAAAAAAATTTTQAYSQASSASAASSSHDCTSQLIASASSTYQSAHFQQCRTLDVSFFVVAVVIFSEEQHLHSEFFRQLFVLIVCPFILGLIFGLIFDVQDFEQLKHRTLRHAIRPE